MDLKINSSTKLREEGNQIYRSIDEFLSPIIRETRLDKCLSLYQQSINSAETYSDLASGYKNHSVVSFQLFKFKFNFFFFWLFFFDICIYFRINSLKDQKKAVYFMNEMQKSAIKAFENGKLSKMSIEWLNKLLLKALEGVDEFFKININKKENDEKIVELILKIKENSFETVECYILYKISLFYYHSSLKQIEYDVNLSYRYINECRFYGEMCHKLSKELDFGISFDIEELISNRIFQECLIDGLRYFSIAEKSFDKMINYEESLNIESIWDCIDLYHEAIVRTRGKNLKSILNILI